MKAARRWLFNRPFARWRPILLLQPQRLSFFLSDLNLESPAKFGWPKFSFAQERKTLEDSGRSGKMKPPALAQSLIENKAQKNIFINLTFRMLFNIYFEKWSKVAIAWITDFWKCIEQHANLRQVYKNEKAHNAYNRCLCFIFNDQTTMAKLQKVFSSKCHIINIAVQC